MTFTVNVYKHFLYNAQLQWRSVDCIPPLRPNGHLYFNHVAHLFNNILSPQKVTKNLSSLFGAKIIAQSD